MKNNALPDLAKVTQMTKCFFNNTLTERDMDLLLMESAITDEGICRMMLDKTSFSYSSFKLVKAELSKTDKDLGESDITLVFEIDGDKYGVLIEDKIDAPAMNEQHERYRKRGERGIERGDYKAYAAFIFCSEKYYRSNTEAKLYEHVLLYEECKKYFDGKEDALSSFRSQQLSQAISKAKSTSWNIDKDANAFFRRYSRYQQENYPTLILTTKETSNGWWPHYSTNLGDAYIHHKIPDGTVDLTFNKAAGNLDEVNRIAEWAKYHGIPDAIPTKRGKAASIRIKVPAFDMRTSFEDVQNEDLDKCFEAIKQLTDFANIMELANSIKKL